MDCALTAEQALGRRTAREFAEAEVAPACARYDEAEEFPRFLRVERQPPLAGPSGKIQHLHAGERRPRP